MQTGYYCEKRPKRQISEMGFARPGYEAAI
jgi:hypothetical protein